MNADRKPLSQMKAALTLALFLAWAPIPRTLAGDASGAGGRKGETEKNIRVDMEQLIEARRRIERVYYEHRIWPKENPGPKPPFDVMVPADVIERKAKEGLLKTAALKQFWKMEITPAMLQAELERMARDTKHPEMLRELFAALDNDTRLIAEVLARDHLADALIREQYASDESLHREARARAERIRRAGTGGDWRLLAEREGVGYSRRTIINADAPHAGDDRAEAGQNEARRLSTEAFEFERKQFVIEAVNLKERKDEFVLELVTVTNNSRLEIESIQVPKASYDLWWSSTVGTVTDTRVDTYNDYRLPEIAQTSGCDQWTPTSIGANVPFARIYHTAVWTGSEMIIWGGNGGGVNGGRYDPATDNWTPTSTGTGVPSRRQWHTAVWTGKEMIIWGGSWFSLMNTGSRYIPLTDSWIQTSLTNAPSVRASHTAVWTGTEMIVWGGGVCNSTCVTFDTGGRYSPDSDSWISTSTGGNVPVARMIHTAVWTGNEMIIWGGGQGCSSSSPSYYENTGGQYNPDTDSWTPTPIENAPTGRSDHSAVWIGSEMIVWGGHIQCYRANYDHVNTGGRLNPASGNWVSTSLGINVPTPRDSHTEVWTGSEMIVWGGVTYGIGYLNTGGRYNAGANLWRPTSTIANVPAARIRHSAVWSGNGMIIWGGYDSSGAFINTGGIYTSGSAPSPANTLRGSKSSSINLIWPWITGAGSYNVKRADLATGIFPYVPTTIVSTPTIPQYSEPDDGQSHFYAVEAVNQCGATP